VSGPFLREGRYIEYIIQVGNSRNRRSRTPIDAYEVAVNAARTTLEVPCDQLRDNPRICYTNIESVNLILDPRAPVDISSGGGQQISLRFPVRVPLRGLFNTTSATLRLGLDYKYHGGSGTLSASRDYAADVNLQKFGLSINVSHSPDSVPLGANAVYSFEVANDGLCASSDEPCDATDISVVLASSGPNGTELVSAELESGSECTLSLPGRADCAISSLSTGSRMRGSVVLRSPEHISETQLKPIELLAFIRPHYDPYEWDNQMTDFTTVDPVLSIVDVGSDLHNELVEATLNDSCTAVYATYRTCNVGTRRLSNLKSATIAMPGSAILVNRDANTPPGVGSERTFYFLDDYEDGVLGPGDCVNVFYHLSNLDSCRVDWLVAVFGHIMP